MAHDADSLRKFTPDFIIAAGTQVVLKVAKPLRNIGQRPLRPLRNVGESHVDETKPPGSVGVVLESPADNGSPYLIRFADGQTAKAYYGELALRRREVEEELGRRAIEELVPYVIYRCQVGSKAFGLAGEDSDDDIRGIYLPPARLQWSMTKLPEQLELTDDCDEVYWELQKFLRLALKANPNVLETLWTPMVLDADQTATELRAIRGAFLSKHVYKTYSGYVLSQFRRMNNAQKATRNFKAKHAMHLIRLLHSGIAAVASGEILIDVGLHRDELLAIRNGERTFEEVQKRALELDAEFQTAFEKTTLPEQPDYRRVDAFLIDARRRMVDA